ncbi:TPA: hypothetical protein DEO28_03220 [Candidatus Dependentiae bacterium]|nr:MAG: hypothetical protein UR14_C0005G0007 [candidate division TM6 bacterium GW2011_GWE2_31_21]KKP53083.1 MAG: hypothetical protein UR43_C0007G0007 [candidate division TM6 bacterium GW2011_GWF2_33_332]HBS47901.1 hypothetical protein [Candidatus Dependentiae bacterium]HBZ73495.1 hypothetical protein [Candidatus Dependentiae bacterium]
MNFKKFFKFITFSVLIFISTDFLLKATPPDTPPDTPESKKDETPKSRKTPRKGHIALPMDSDESSSEKDDSEQFSEDGDPAVKLTFGAPGNIPKASFLFPPKTTTHHKLKKKKEAEDGDQLSDEDTPTAGPIGFTTAKKSDVAKFSKGTFAYLSKDSLDEDDAKSKTLHKKRISNSVASSSSSSSSLAAAPPESHAKRTRIKKSLTTASHSRQKFLDQQADPFAELEDEDDTAPSEKLKQILDALKELPLTPGSGSSSVGFSFMPLPPEQQMRPPFSPMESPILNHPIIKKIDRRKSQEITLLIRSTQEENEKIAILNLMAEFLRFIKNNDEITWFDIVQKNRFLQNIISACVELNQRLPINLRKNLNNLIIDYRHIFEMQHQSGFHFLGDKETLILPETKEENPITQVFCAYHHVSGECPNGKFSTFFPQRMSKRDVIESVRNSFNLHKIASSESKYISFDAQYNIYLEVFLKNENGIITITSAFPILYFIQLDREHNIALNNSPYSPEVILKSIREATKKEDLDILIKYKTERRTTILDIAPILKLKNATKAESGIYVEVSNEFIEGIEQSASASSSS